ncbi:hypothetical protein ABZ511_20005, partial [Nocardia gamkensis]|uniref:hypothetical protein n=1 Tax=Nocardia gamkensis TaxID=352869 RepID=UPI00340FC798
NQSPKTQQNNRQQKADKNVRPSTRGVKDRNQIKHLALTFIDTLLSSQRTHAHTFTPNILETSVRQLFQLSPFVHPIKIGLPFEPCDGQALLVLPRFPVHPLGVSASLLGSGSVSVSL